MKRTELSLSLNSLKHQIVTNLSIMTRPSFTFARLVKTSHNDGFTWGVELCNKHMLSSSILIKIKRYWSTMTRENGKRGKPLYGSRSLLNMTLSLHHCDYMGWVICLMVIIPLSIKPSITLVLGHCYQFIQCRRHVQEKSFSRKSSFAILINLQFHGCHS